MNSGGNRNSPERWSDNLAGAPLGAANLLRGAQRPRLATERELARLQATVELLARTPEPTLSVSAWAGWRSFWTRPSRAVAFGAFVVTVSMLGTAVALWRVNDGHRRLAPEIVLQPARPAAPPFRASLGPAAAASPLVQPDVKAPAAVLQRHTPARRARHLAPSVTTPTEPPVGESLLREATLIERARGALSADPGHALALLDQHRHEAPDGQLAPERDFLSVAALCALGDVEQASRRAAALDRRKPTSAYAARAWRLVEAARQGAAGGHEQAHDPGDIHGNERARPATPSGAL